MVNEKMTALRVMIAPVATASNERKIPLRDVPRMSGVEFLDATIAKRDCLLQIGKVQNMAPRQTA